MIIGVPRETKMDEYRVGLLPVGAHLLSVDGHSVLVEQSAGEGSGFEDRDYEAAGAEVASSSDEIYERADLVLKVKEPQPAETARLHPGQTVFCYFHFAGSRDLTTHCLERGISALAYETLSDSKGRLPLLTPMSEIAGRMAIQEGAKCLERPGSGRGVLLGGVPGVERATVLVIGGGVVGSNAARVAAGMGANVVVMDVNLDRLRYLDEVMPANVTTVFCDPHALQRYATQADLVIGAVLIPGGKSPVLIARDRLKTMKTGSVLVDVSIDQGGCFETSRATTHREPTFIVDGVVHYCVANIPGAVSRTSSHALCNATLPYCRDLARLGVDGFLSLSEGHRAALNMKEGKLTNAAVSAAFPDLPVA